MFTFPLDISIVETSLEFPSGGQSESRCVSVMITSDGLFEGEETVCVALQSSNSDIAVGADTCIVIEDNDRKYS